MKLATPLPTGILRNDGWLDITDQQAFLRLNDLVRKATNELSSLGCDPIAIAASPNRFDDACNYEWRAVRCGPFFSEKGSYLGKHDLDRDIHQAPNEAKTAYDILRSLEQAGWRDLFATAFDIYWSDQSLAVVVQDRLTWLVFSSNNVSDDGDPVFAVWDEDPMSYFGEAEERFDWAIQSQRPLVFLTDSGEHIAS